MRSRTQDTTDHAALRLIIQRSSCPSNDALAAAIGARGPASGAAALARLERTGKVTIKREGGWRWVTVTDFNVTREGEDA